jgi:GNAT superfamily N-acetyltransferase
VHADWTRRGLGTRILEACEPAARQEGFTRLALVATLPGVALYKRYGFVRREEVIVTMPNGTSVAAVAMDKPVA